MARLSSSFSSPTSRRQEYAAATRDAIIQAGRELFAQQGFIATKVEDIAARARVAPATVYTSVGGKHAILTTLMEQLATWQPREDSFALMRQATTSREVLAILARDTRETRETWDDVQRILSETAPHDPEAATIQAERIGRYRSALDNVAQMLADHEGPDFDLDGARVTLWFHFGPNAYQPLRDDLKWSYPEAEAWLLARCVQAIGLAGEC